MKQFAASWAVLGRLASSPSGRPFKFDDEENIILGPLTKACAVQGANVRQFPRRRCVVAKSEVTFTIKINGSPELVKDLEHVIRQNSEIKLESVGPSDEASRLKLGLGEVSTIIAIVNGTITLGKFAYTVCQHLRKKPDERVTIQTPLKTVVILSSDADNEEHVRALLLSATQA